MDCPLDYSLCDQTVTSYRRERDGSVARTVHPRAFLDFKKVRNVEKTGSADAASFLLVVPGSADIREGDKVLMGDGPEIGPSDWASFIPSKVRGLCVVRWTDPKHWRGEVCHVEAGG